MRTRAKTSQSFASASPQAEFFYDDVYAIERHIVAALGGAKIVGPKMFPKKPADAAERYLLDCVNPNNAHGLGEEGFIFLLKLARAKGVHLGMHWLCDELLYARATSIEPQDKAAEIMRRVDFYRDQLREQLVELDRLPKGI